MGVGTKHGVFILDSKIKFLAQRRRGAKDGGQRTEDRRRMTEGGGRRTEGQRTEEG